MNSKIVLLLMLYFVSTQASHYPDLLQALDSLLCENVDKKYSTIIDIKQSISKGADLVDGTLADNLGSCISECCGQERCDFALYKIEGSSSSGKNCYFINCGSSMSNCVLVDHPGFTSVVMGRRKQNKEEISKVTDPVKTTPSTAAPTPSTKPLVVALKTNEPLMPTTPPLPHPKMTTPIASVNNTQSPSDIKLTDKTVSHAESKPKEGDTDKAVVDNVGHPGSPQESGGSGMIAAIIVGVVCFTIVVIVVGVLAKKVWSDHNRRKFRNVDYLINGMYT